MIKARLKARKPELSTMEISQAALAWAEFLYDEYMFKKHKQLLLDKQQYTLDADKEGQQ